MSFTLRLSRCLRPLLLLLFAAFLLALAGQAAWALRFDPEAVLRHSERKYGREGTRRLEQWLSMLDRSSAMPDSRGKLAVVNDFWNKNVRESTDEAIWKREDYWATPLEALGRGMADCEDFVIGKYFSLVHAGVSPDALRLIYVRATVRGRSIAHMVLGYYTSPDADPLILDNLRISIQPASQRPDLTPVFSFNANGVYVAGAARGPIDRISRWQGLLLRMQQEGFQP